MKVEKFIVATVRQFSRTSVGQREDDVPLVTGASQHVDRTHQIDTVDCLLPFLSATFIATPALRSWRLATTTWADDFEFSDADVDVFLQSKGAEVHYACA